MKTDDYLKLSNKGSGIFETGLTKWEMELGKVMWRVEIVGKGQNTTSYGYGTHERVFGFVMEP